MKSRTKTRIKFLERDEVDRVIAQSRNVQERAIMHVLFSTGVRVAECVAINRASLRATPETQELSIIGKGGYQRVVFFSPACLNVVAGYLNTRTDNDERLFPVTKRTVERIVKRAALAAGLKATPHTFRHSLATHLLRQGANIRIVQRVLGHQSLSSTQVYTGVTDRDLLEAHKKFL